MVPLAGSALALRRRLRQGRTGRRHRGKTAPCPTPDRRHEVRPASPPMVVQPGRKVADPGGRPVVPPRSSATVRTGHSEGPTSNCSTTPPRAAAVGAAREPL
eukprot:gene4721-biopygen13031